MNKPLKTLLMLALLAFHTPLFSQEKQEENMADELQKNVGEQEDNIGHLNNTRIHRQIEMAEMILDQLAIEIYQKKSSVYMVYHKNAKGIYVENKGVVIKLSPLPTNQTLLFPTKVIQVPLQHSNTLYVQGQANNAYLSQSSGDTTQNNKQDLAKELMEVFYLKYGSIFRDLKGEEKLILTFEGSKTSVALHNNIRFYSLGQNTNNRFSFTSSLAKADIDAYENGQINEEKLLSRIEYTETNEASKPAEDMLEFNVFARILRKLIADDMNKDNWSISLNQNDRRFEDFGYVLEFTFSENKKLKNSEATKMDFIESTKEHILNYGPTLKSLKSDESLLVILKNRNPKDAFHIKFEVKKKVLEAYERQELNLAQAKEQIKVEINLKK